MGSKEKLNVYCRPARQSDTEDVMDLTSTIWDGDDYVPEVWAKWLADPEGMLAVAEHEDRVIGLGKLTHLAPGEWWLEGLRTHPEYEGRGVASHLHEYLLHSWLQEGDGVLRLATASFRQSVQHLCERTGFEKTSEFTFFKAPALGADQDGFQLISKDETRSALETCLSSSSLSLSHGLMDLGWQWTKPAMIHIQATVDRQRAWWWRSHQGVLLLTEDTDHDGNRMANIQLLACPLESLEDMLAGYRHLAASLGYKDAGWTAPPDPFLTPLLEKTGFERSWDASVYVYTKQHPDRL